MTDGIRWKNGARCAVTLSFDIDGESPWIHRDQALAERPLHMSMGAYGPKTGVPRILRLLDRYDIKSIIIYGFKRSFYPGSYLNKRQYVRQIIDYYDAVERKHFG